MDLKQVMVVEDEPLVRELAGRILRRAGYDVVLCGSGNVCLSLLEAGFGGVILMDIRMPGLSGWQTIEAIADMGYTENNVISLMTGYTAYEPRHADLLRHVCGAVRKPFLAADLIATVDACQHANQLASVAI